MAMSVPGVNDGDDKRHHTVDIFWTQNNIIPPIRPNVLLIICVHLGDVLGSVVYWQLTFLQMSKIG